MHKSVALGLLFLFVMIFAGTVAAANSTYVQINNSASNYKPNVGQQFNYTVTALNYGPDDAKDVQISDVIPSGLTLNSYTSTPGTTYNNASGIWNIGTLNKGSSVYLNLSVTPTVSVAGQNISNTATRIAETTNDSAPITSIVNVHVPESNVVITKETNSSTPNVGKQFTYTLTATNYGPDDASGLQIQDIIPSGLIKNGYNASTGTYYLNNIWYIGNLTNGTTVTLNLYVIPTSSIVEKNITNTAVKSAENEYDPSPTSASVTVYIPRSEVVINKTTSNITPYVGQQFTYTITATNNGPDDATSLQITDNIPSGLTLNSYTSSSETTYNSSTGIWNIGTLTKSSTVYLYLLVTPKSSVAGQTVTNTATKTNEDQYDLAPLSSSVNINVQQQAYVVLTKETSNSTPNVGQEFIYTITATNDGPNDATGLQITDILPAGLTLNSYTFSSGTIFNESNGIWYIGNLVNGSSAWLKLYVTPTASVAGKQVTNTATKTAETTYDLAPLNASTTIYVPLSEVLVNKTTSNYKPNVGEEYYYTINAANNGPDNATNLRIVDIIPSGLTLNSYTCSSGTTYNNSTGLWDIGTLNNSTTVSLVLYVTPKENLAGQIISNSAVIISEDEYNPKIDTSFVNVYIPKSNVVLTKNTSNNTPDIGQEFSYTITATNNGDDATNLQVTDNIPTWLTLNSYTCSSGTTYDSSTGIWNIGTLTENSSVWLKLNVTPQPSSAGQTITNTATKTSEDQYDPETKTVNVNINVPVESYVTLNKTTSNTKPTVGEQYTYTINAKNYSPYTATGLKVTDKIPSGLTLNSYTCSSGTTYDSSTGIWDIGTLIQDSNAWIEFNVTPNLSLAGQTVTNTATKTSEDQFDPASKTASVDILVTKSYVVLNKTVNNNVPNIGQLFTYTISAKNTGPTDAAGLQITDKIPTGLTLKSYTCSTGTTYNSTTGIWNIGTLTKNSSVWLKLNVTAAPSLSGKTVTNTVTRTTESTYDPAPLKTSINIKVPVESYVLLSKTASNIRPNAGQQYTYTIYAKNYSPYTATGLKVTDKITSGLTLRSYACSSGTTYNSSTSIWNIGTLKTGSSVWLKLNVIPKVSLIGKNVTNTATRFAETTFDPAPKTASVTVQVSTTVTINQLTSAASDVKLYYEHNNVLPPNVTIGGKTVVSTAQFLQLLVTGTINLNIGKTTAITVQNVKSADSPSGTFHSGNILKTEYLTIAQNIQSFIKSNGRAPNYANTSLGNIPFEKLVYMYSKIMNFYGAYIRLPNYVNI